MTTLAKAPPAAPDAAQPAPPSGPPLQVADYLGPAEVVEALGSMVTARIGGAGVVLATLALPLPYEPTVGDVLLVIGRQGEYWVLGVIRGAGRAVLRVAGDVELHAEGGALRLTGDKGVRITGAEIGLETGKLSVVAASLLEQLGSAVRRVAGLLTTQAGRSHTVVDGSAYEQSKNHAIVSEETVTVNGKQIHLG
jgi:hypothetical protein